MVANRSTSLMCRDPLVKTRKLASLKVIKPPLNALQGSKKILIVEAQPQRQHSWSELLNSHSR